MNLVRTFREFGRIYGLCPCCGELFRLNEAQLFTRNLPPKTPLDEVADRQERLDLRVERFEDREARIRAEATEAGYRAARRRLRRIAPFFLTRRIDPNDVKVLFSPVQYVAFRGMTDGECRSVELIDTPAASKDQAALQESLFRAIQARNLEWWTLRISEDASITIERPD